MAGPNERGLRHDDDIYQGPATQSASAAPTFGAAGLSTGQVAALIALLALAGLTILRATIASVLPN